MNRNVFAFNHGLDSVLFKPLAQAYLYFPEVARDGISNMVGNVRAPVNLANDLFQGEFSQAATTLSRFVINTTIGLGGMFDVAAGMGMERHSEDFGQTLGTWGSPTGPYVVIPVLGPSSPRAIVGSVADSFLDPLTYLFENQNAELEYMLTRGGIEGVDERSSVLAILDDIEQSSLDFYATIRSLYRQRREAEMLNGTEGTDVPGPSFMTYTDSFQSAGGGSIVQ
jgi:phospholipid-binding lipoprotein MlaA